MQHTLNQSSGVSLNGDTQAEHSQDNAQKSLHDSLVLPSDEGNCSQLLEVTYSCWSPRRPVS